ncbi:MAG: PorT family protein [Cyclobacteriaceae bacterium]|nr:PorT family protein [Cyclobacteriaceae bacterium]
MGKKSFLAFAFITLISVSVVAQSKFTMGLKVGPNLSSVNANSTTGETYKSITGYHGGLFATIKGSKIGFQPEILFSKQGYILKTTAGQDVFDFKYVNVPMIIKWYMVKGLNLQVGPQLDLLTSAIKEAADGTNTNQTNILRDRVWNLCVGLGLDLPFKINIDARYVIGLTDVNTLTSAGTALKSSVVQFSLGYRFLDKGKSVKK